jgi:transcriptional regulator with XRE-family HTH domain
MGNKSYHLNSHLLRELREQKGWTQAETGRKLAEYFGTDGFRSPARMANDYQRIGLRGSSRRKTAEALATIFGVSLAVLQGQEIPEPIEYVQQIRSLLQQALECGDNKALRDAVQRSTERDPDRDPQSAFTDFAFEIAARIEFAQLTHNPVVLAELTQLTGLPESELLRPANLDGYWLINTSGRGQQGTQVIRGLYGLEMHIRELVSGQLKCYETDNSIRLRRDYPWCRVEIERPRWRDTIKLEIVRCKPERNGIRWHSPTGDEKERLESALVLWAMTAANFVQRFEMPMTPSAFRNLRLRVTEYNGLAGEVVGQTVINCDYDDMPPNLLDSVQIEGQTHLLAVNWLTAALEDWLTPHIAEWPSRCWSVSHGHHVDITFYAPVTAPEQPSGLRYRIELVEEVSSGEYISAPFREKDRTALVERIKAWVK